MVKKLSTWNDKQVTIVTADVTAEKMKNEILLRRGILVWTVCFAQSYMACGKNIGYGSEVYDSRYGIFEKCIGCWI